MVMGTGQLRLGVGADGADRALLRAADLHAIRRGCATVQIASGDGAFADFALGAKAVGLTVIVAAWARSLSSRLARAADLVILLTANSRHDPCQEETQDSGTSRPALVEQCRTLGGPMTYQLKAPEPGDPSLARLICSICRGARWVCSSHPLVSWHVGHEHCNSPGTPCLACNQGPEYRPWSERCLECATPEEFAETCKADEDVIFAALIAGFSRPDR